MTIYFTFNDPPSGIYSSQVVDVVKFLQSELAAEIRLVSFISLRGYLSSRKQIKKQMPDAVVVPMFPGVRNWRMNFLTLKMICAVLKANTIIARSVLATQLALSVKGDANVIYDGRGAIAAEWKEYRVVNDRHLLNEIELLEKEAVLASDARISVSKKLVEHWRNSYQYAAENHQIIPCTLNSQFELVNLSKETILLARVELGIAEEDTVFVFSGSVSGWQSLQHLRSFMEPVLRQSHKSKLLFLSPAHSSISELQTMFPNQVTRRHFEPGKVPQALIAGDYGLLLREQTLTNQVASPVKFAEYLVCGLKVIISEDLGDYTDFVQRYNAGYLPPVQKSLHRPSFQEKMEMRKLALEHFTKRNFRTKYLQLIEKKQ